MNGGPYEAWLPDGRRLHLQYGPIDLILQAFGDADEVSSAYRQAVARFGTILDELVAELPTLRRSLGQEPPLVEGAVARRMAHACSRHVAAAPNLFLTPMAAVAGAVADEVLAAMRRGRALSRAYVNDGGDIALYLTPGHRFKVGIVAEVGRPQIAATVTIDAALPVRGIATSGRATHGRGGRSFSLGIADAVTALARDGASADAAATLIANAVTIASPAVERRPARALQADSDLGDLPVVVAVGPLSEDDVSEALEAGQGEAQAMRDAGLIDGAFLSLRGRHRSVGMPQPALGASQARPDLRKSGDVA